MNEAVAKNSQPSVPDRLLYSAETERHGYLSIAASSREIHYKENGISLPIPFQAYVNADAVRAGRVITGSTEQSINYLEQNKVQPELRVAMLVAGFGGVQPDLYFDSAISELSGLRQPPDIIIVTSYPGYHLNRSDNQLLDKKPDLVDLKLYPQLFHEMMAHSLQLTDQVNVNGLPVSVAVVGHSAAVWGLPGIQSERGADTGDLISSLIEEYRSQSQTQLEVSYMALAPCGKLQRYLALLQNVFEPLHRLAEPGLPPYGYRAMVALKRFLEVIGADPRWWLRAELWSTTVHQRTFVSLPGRLHHMGVPQPTAGSSRPVFFVYPEHEHVAEIDPRANTRVVGGTHSTPNINEVVALIDEQFEQLGRQLDNAA